MYIRKVHGLKTESWRTPANTDEQFKHKSLSTTFWDLLFNKLFRGLRKFHDIPITQFWIVKPHVILYQMLRMYLGILLSLQE